MSYDETGSQSYLPVSYNQNYIKIVAKDSNTVYVYWEITTDTKFNFQNIFGKLLWDSSRTVIRVRNFSNNKIFFIEVTPDSSSCYFYIQNPGEIINAEVGKMVGGEFFISFAASNTTELPNNTISTEKAIQFADIKMSNKFVSSTNTDEIYKHFGFNDVFKVLGPSSIQHTEYVDEHGFNK
jgi:hypothetical protein